MTGFDSTGEDILARINSLNVNKSGERRAPHKPLLILIALGQLLAGKRQSTFDEIKNTLLPLLNSFAPPVSARHQPELPYWHLRSDGLWVLDDENNLEYQKSGFPRIGSLRQTSAGFPNAVATAFLSDQRLVDEVIHRLLDRHFPASLQAEVLSAVGLNIDDALSEPTVTSTKRNRDPGFRDKVLRAYEHRCAVTGFRASLGASYFGCEAAHVQWHAYDGPDTVANGICLEPTLHKLFDAGAWTLTDDHRVLVSAEFSGSDSAVEKLRSTHGKPIHAPLPGQPTVSAEYLKWHRDPGLGGVFREPALPI